MKGFAIHNAPTDHGGRIPATQMRSSQMGNLFVVAGDGHFCPKCKCWSTVLKSHDHVIFDGKAVAYAGDKLSCGARILPQQSHVVGDSGSYSVSLNKKSLIEKKHLKRKEIKEILWTYSDAFIPIGSKSRHFVDLNLHVKTENYEVGEMVEIILKYEDGDFLFDEVIEFKVSGTVGENDEAIIKNVLKNKILNLK